MKLMKTIFFSAIALCALAIPSAMARGNGGHAAAPANVGAGQAGARAGSGNHFAGRGAGFANRGSNGRHWNHGRGWRNRGYSNFYFGGFYPYGYGYGDPYYDGYGYGYGSYGYGSPYSGRVYEGREAEGDVDTALVVQVQRRLARAGYYNGTVDGVVGAQTRNAIRRYERSHRLPVDGEIDDDLLARMGLA
jgi:Putative peptidoglycan binding domain